MMEVYFFGCQSKSSAGHYLYTRPFWDSTAVFYRLRDELGVSLDAGLLIQAGVRDIPGLGCYVQRGGYSIVAWWDRDGDSRPNSNSAFIVKGGCTPQEVMRLGREAFPTITRRSAVKLPDGTQL